jgi:hypothetical protein
MEWSTARWLGVEAVMLPPAIDNATRCALPRRVRKYGSRRLDRVRGGEEYPSEAGSRV